MVDLFVDTAGPSGPVLPWWVFPVLALLTSVAVAVVTRGGPAVVGATAVAAGGALVAATAGVGGGPRRRWATPAGVVVVAAAVVLASGTTGDPGSTVAFAALGVVVAAGTAVTAGHGGPTWVAWPWAAATAGVYLALPDTEGARALAAGLVVAGVVSLAARRWNDTTTGGWPGPPVVLGAAAWSVPVVWVAGHDATGRVAPRIAALAAAGVLVAWPAARLLLRCRPGPPRVGWVSLTLVQVPAAVVVARVGGVRVDTTRAVVTAVVVLLALLVVLGAAEWLLHRAHAVRAGDRGA